VLGEPSLAAATDDEIAKPDFAERPALVPIIARPDRIVSLNVCPRPFRAEGPRIDIERVRGKTIVRNYGHGGSGWSLSWGAGGGGFRQPGCGAGSTGLG
jgi:hypothetical protein